MLQTGRTPIHCAATYGHTQILAKLMNNGRAREIQNRDHVSIVMFIRTYICEGEGGG